MTGPEHPLARYTDRPGPTPLPHAARTRLWGLEVASCCGDTPNEALAMLWEAFGLCLENAGAYYIALSTPEIAAKP